MSFRRTSQRSKSAREEYEGKPAKPAKRDKGLRLFQFLGNVSDWVAARDEGEARTFLMQYYGISDRHIERNYRSICEVNPTGIEFVVETDADEKPFPEHEDVQTAAQMMLGRVKPFLVGSTCG